MLQIGNGGTLDIQSGARLQGNGTVGTTTLRSGATVAPGNSIGNLSMTGDVTFEKGATYEVEVNPEGRMRRLRRLALCPELDVPETAPGITSDPLPSSPPLAQNGCSSGHISTPPRATAQEFVTP